MAHTDRSFDELIVVANTRKQLLVNNKTSLFSAVARRNRITSRSLSLVAVLAASFSLAACEDKTLGNNIDDAMDNRPAEGLQDAVEDVKDDINDATN